MDTFGSLSDVKKSPEYACKTFATPENCIQYGNIWDCIFDENKKECRAKTADNSAAEEYFDSQTADDDAGIQIKNKQTNTQLKQRRFITCISYLCRYMQT